MVQVTLLKPIVMQKLDGTNIIIQLEAQNHRNIFKATSTTVLFGLSFKIPQKILRPGGTFQNHVLLLPGNLVFKNRRTLKG